MGMILDQFGNPLPEPPNPYDALMADFMADAIKAHLADSGKWDRIFGGSRLVDERGDPIASTKQVKFVGRSVRCPVTVKPQRHPENIAAWADQLAADVCDAND